MKTSLEVPFSATLPTSLYLRTTLMPNDAIFPAHIHSWGEFVYCHNGVVQVGVEQETFLVPPQYGVWVPPNIRHLGFNRKEVLQSSLYVTEKLCRKLPPEPRALFVSSFMRSILDHAQKTVTDHQSAKHLRLLRVFLDELQEAKQTRTYLPATEDETLKSILNYLENHPNDNRSVFELAGSAKITERTLARKCRKELGMTLSEWRNRMRVLHAVKMLEKGERVQCIARRFGYSSASAFIAMFKNLTGTTPASYKTKIHL